MTYLWESIVDKILIVDDELDIELLMKQKFRRQIKEKQFTLYFAQNGVEALEMLAKERDIRLLISDINMPEMDGLTLLKHIGEQFPDVIPVIVSAYGDMNNIRQAMNLGAFDFVTKPINFEDLTITISKTLKHIQNLIESEKTKTKLDSILHELNVASEIQQSILPRNFINDEYIQLYAKMTAAKAVGGDFYDFFWIDEKNKKLAVVIADVSGKGVPAALFMTVSRTLIRANAFNDLSPGQVCTKVNLALEKDNSNMMFVTAFYGILDVESGAFTYCNAGHNPPHILKNGKIETLTALHGMALGVMSEQTYKEDTIIFDSNDLLFLYTDGVTEAETSNGNFFSDQNLIDKLHDHQHLAVNELVNTIGSEVVNFAAGWPQSDDITMLALRFLSKKTN